MNDKGKEQRRLTIGAVATRGSPWRTLAFLLLMLPLVASAQPEQVFRPLDLSRFYNTSPTDLLADAPGFPQGTQIFDAIPFLLGGKVEVTGVDAASHGEFLPPEIAGIPVQQKLTRLHLLHGASHGQRDGTPLANVILHFKNGETRTLRLAFGVHTRNWISEMDEKKADLGDPNSHLVWSSEQRKSKQPFVRLFRTPLDNPLPDEEVTSIDFVSLFSRATPVLFAITVQNGGDITALRGLPKKRMNQRANQFPDSVYRRNIAVRVTDNATGASLTNAVGLLSVKDDARSFFFGQYQADGSGRIAAPYPPQQAVSLTLRVSSPGFVPGVATLSMQSPQPWPDVLEIALKRGQPIGGLVKGSDGKPIGDANVIPFEIKQTGPKQYTRYDLDAVKTGPDGKWLTAALGESLTNVSFEVTHPEYHSVIARNVPAPELLDSKAIMTLTPHVRIVGRILDGSGAALGNATVILDQDDSFISKTVDRDGKFSFVVRDPTNNSAHVIATAPDLAPAVQLVSLEAEAKPIDLVLRAGQPFKMRMLDQNKEPVADVKVTLMNWQGTKGLQWRTQTDAEGRFVWEHAPEGSVVFRFEKTGHYVHTHSTTLPSTSEYQFTYTRMLTVAGKVIDAETKKPIDRFTVVKRYQYENNTPKRWNRYSSTTGRKGSFSSTLGGISQAQWTLVIEAKGYEPLSSEIFTGSYSNVFELKKAMPFTGKVVSATGAPIPKTEVILLDSNSNAYMDQGGKFRRTPSYYEVVITDANGAFELTPKVDADVICAAHPKFGFAQTAVSDLQKNGKIVLQPWGYVKGVLRVGDKVEPNQGIAIHTDYQQASASGRSPPLYLYYQAKPNPDGSFFFEMVPPGPRIAYLRYQFPNRNGGTIPLSHDVRITVKPGETNDVVIGGTGRTVVGKVNVKPRNPTAVDVPVDWLRDVHTLRFQAPPTGMPPPLSIPPNATPEERQRLIQQQNRARQEYFRERSRLMAAMERTYVLLFDEDGSFRVPSVPPGTYSLLVHPTDPRQPNSFRQIGSLSTQITIPEGEGPHDAGTFQLTVNL